jgi:hypothetical protein
MGLLLFSLFGKKGEFILGAKRINLYFCLPFKNRKGGNTERCLSGRKERFAKSSYGLHCTVGSNPTLSAKSSSLNPSVAGVFCLERTVELARSGRGKQKTKAGVDRLKVNDEDLSSSSGSPERSGSNPTLSARTV